MLFMWVVLPAFGAASYVPSIVLERPLFVREQSDGLYRVSTYLAFKMIEEFSLAFINSIGEPVRRCQRAWACLSSRAWPAPRSRGAPTLPPG